MFSADDPPRAAPAPARGDRSGWHALCLLARLHQTAADPDQLRHQLAHPADAPVTLDDLLLGVRQLGLKGRCCTSSTERLQHIGLPAIAAMRDGSFALLAQCDGQRVLLQEFCETEHSRPKIEPLDSFAQRWSGRLLLVTSRASLVGEMARFDFSWFVPAIVKYRRLFGEVLVVSLFLQLFALVSPLFFQVVMDKVLVHHGLTTLDVLVIGLLVVVTFESVLTGLRSYLFSHTSSRIDVELGARLFRHLLNLPLAWFEARRVGDSVARVRELENIRSFLTGQSISLLLDLLFSVIFIAVMFAYSTPLTLIVLASLPLYVALSLMIVPVLRGRLNVKFARGAENQALLVETVSGIQTVKAGALEPALARRWDQQLAAYVSASFRTQTLATCGHEGVALVGKLTSAVMLWYGARLVMEQQLSVGQFVAFSMFAQRVAQPILRMAQTWTDFQQVGISMARLGDILDTRTEVPSRASGQLAPIRGQVRFDAVSFRYRPQSPLVLHGLDLAVEAGQVIGIVGRSGSGKSTLTKLVQRLYSPEHGRVLIDGIDIAAIDATQLRRQIGVVLQENLLFNRSVRENIAIADPAAPIELVVQVARLAGAHDFICQLPDGYDTVVGEQGTGLSGGQRQRIAIARALFTDPRILILDEATSALDYESEAALQANMAAICAGRTVIVIAHRLSSVRHAHRIVVLDQGRIAESGTHDELLRTHGLYAHLWAMQAGVR
ncbi:type I secretion system permease/ATPase [Piscinibacter sakaiensis]|uniref:type I secretion system permease/ATPase n=1 Tax=Piscinibacter sakaiensis TaxID=1547922 RepID=UPI003AAE0EA7